MDEPYELMTSPADVGADGPSGRRSPSERLLARLLTALIERTEAGSAAWEVDDAHAESFCLGGHGWLVATRSVDADGSHPYELLVAGPSGETVLEVSSTSAFARPLAKLFSRLHAAAAATATLAGTQGLVTRIVAELEDPP
jgi:hypothetical protein